MFIAAMVTPGVLLWQASLHLPTNPAHSPTILAPGDTVRVQLPCNLQGIKGLWRAQGTAKVLNAKPLDVPDPGPLRTESNDDWWGGFLGVSGIRVRPDEHSVPLRLWADVTLPDNDKFANKSVEMKIHLKVEYPKLMSTKPAEDGSLCYWNYDAESDWKVEAHLTSRSSSRFYHFLGGVGGVGLLILAAGSCVLGQLARNPVPAPSPVAADR
jgi:hypothetical protein